MLNGHIVASACTALSNNHFDGRCANYIIKIVFFLVRGSHNRINFDHMKRSDQQKKWVHSQSIIIKKTKTKRSASSYGIIVGTNMVTFSRGGTAVGCPWDLNFRASPPLPSSQLRRNKLPLAYFNKFSNKKTLKIHICNT